MFPFSLKLDSLFLQFLLFSLFTNLYYTEICSHKSLQNIVKFKIDLLLLERMHFGRFPEEDFVFAIVKTADSFLSNSVCS